MRFCHISTDLESILDYPEVEEILEAINNESIVDELEERKTVPPPDIDEETGTTSDAVTYSEEQKDMVRLLSGSGWSNEKIAAAAQLTPEDVTAIKKLIDIL